MGGKIKLCQRCKKNPVKDYRFKYCSDCKKILAEEWRIKSHNNRKNEPKTFPKWICPKGHINQLKFDPRVHKIMFRNHKCKTCGITVREVNTAW